MEAKVLSARISCQSTNPVPSLAQACKIKETPVTPVTTPTAQAVAVSSSDVSSAIDAALKVERERAGGEQSSLKEEVARLEKELQASWNARGAAFCFHSLTCPGEMDALVETLKRQNVEVERRQNERLVELEVNLSSLH